MRKAAVAASAPSVSQMMAGRSLSAGVAMARIQQSTDARARARTVKSMWIARE